MNGDRPVRQLVDALGLWLAHQADPQGDDREFLARHPELRELLEPMLRGSSLEPTESAPRMIGEFRIVRELGRGGTGIVYEAVQTSLARRVALKVLATPLGAPPQVIARFRREAGLLARLSHRNIVPVYWAGTNDGVPYHAMEFVDGCTLAAVLSRLSAAPPASLDGNSLAAAQRDCLGDPTAGNALVGASHLESVLRCVLPIAEALSTAHAHGILHRDVKPANLLLRRDGAPLLSDFGLARDADDPAMTRAGDFAGTPHYVSPEQAAGDPSKVDHRTDVFSMAVVVYEMLLLDRPFDGDTSAEVIEQVRLHEPSALRRRDGRLPEDLACVLDLALQKAPADRYGSMAEFAQELRAVLDSRPVRARRRGPVGRIVQALRRRPLHAALFASLAFGVPAVGGLGIYVWSQQSRIASALLAERLPKVERLLETILLEQDYGRLTDQTHLAQAALDLLPDQPEALAAALYCELLEGDREAVARLRARLLEIAPDVAEQMSGALPTSEPQTALAWFVRGLRLIEHGHTSGEITAFEAAARALRHAMDRAPTPRSIYHCQLLHALIHLRDPGAIRALADDIRHRWPDSPFAAYWCGFALLDVDAELAASELQRAIDSAPELPQPHARLGRMHELAGRTQEAAACYRRARDLAPGTALASACLSRVLLTLDRRSEALATAGDAIRLDPELPSSQSAFGLALAAAGREAEALAALARAIELAPLSASPLLDRARLLVRAQRLDEALADADRAVALEPKAWQSHSVRGLALLHAQRPAEAARAFEQVLAIRADLLPTWRGLAQARRRSGDLPGAHDAIASALRLSPDDGQTHLELGKLLRAENRSDAAKVAFEKAIEQDVRVAEALVNLAGLRAELGDLEGALAKLAEARRVEPTLREAWMPAFGFLETLGRREECLALRTAYLAWNPRELGQRVALVRSVLMGEANPLHDELLRKTFAELATLGAEERDDVRLLRAMHAIQRGEQDSARDLLQRVIASTTASPAQRDEARGLFAKLRP